MAKSEQKQVEAQAPQKCYLNLELPAKIKLPQDIKFSVLIPTRNREDYILDAINSVLATGELSLEIIVSENWSDDSTAERLATVKDSRVKVVRPDKSLSMHENFEYLLGLASGEWVTFLGDDDGIMPYSFLHMREMIGRFSHVEAICSARAYYCWAGTQLPTGHQARSYTAKRSLRMKDSKVALSMCLNGSMEYFDAPQLYTGGFHKRTLVQRVKRLQGGRYFQSVTPDAYSALMCMLHTASYIRSEVPLFWTGTSPSVCRNTSHAKKDRDKDFWGMHDPYEISHHPSLKGIEMKNASFTLNFYEAYISAVPFTNASHISLTQLRSLLKANQMALLTQERSREADELATDALKIGIRLSRPWLFHVKAIKLGKLIKKKSHLLVTLFKGELICRLDMRKYVQECTINTYCKETRRCIDSVQGLKLRKVALNHYHWK